MRNQISKYQNQKKYNQLRDMERKAYFNTWEFQEAKALVQQNPKKAKEQYEKYLSNYPKDYLAYTYYILVLIRLGYLEKASKVYKYIEEKYSDDQNFSYLSSKAERFKFNMIFCKFRLLSFQEKYQELYHFYINHHDVLNKYESYDLLFYLKKKLGYVNQDNERPHSYFNGQIFDYQEKAFREYIKKHLYEHNIDTDEPNESIFKENFPIDEVITEVKKYIPSDKKTCIDFFQNLYTFKFDECGRYKGKVINYFRVKTFNNTQQLITIYPATNAENFDYIDLNYLNKKENVKIKTKSQIEKFKERYHR